jgi:hypothetical protein
LYVAAFLFVECLKIQSTGTFHARTHGGVANHGPVIKISIAPLLPDVYEVVLVRALPLGRRRSAPPTMIFEEKSGSQSGHTF